MENSDLEKNEFDLLIISHLTGSATEKEMITLKNWLNISEENINYFNILKNAWVLSGKNYSDSATQAEESWISLKNRMDHKYSGIQGRKNVRLTTYLKLAASWLLIFCLGSSITWWFTNKPKTPESSLPDRITEIITPLGARSQIKLPDSTIIWLNAGTTISYREDYGRQTRTLNLKGEAYFKVAKDSLHPFLVNTQGIVVHAIGTRFNVKAYPEEKTISATLEEGRIDIRLSGISDKNEKHSLKPKDKLIYFKETGKTEKYIENGDERIKMAPSSTLKQKDINIQSNVRTELYTSWKDPRWIIFREPLSTLTPMLERRFNLKIFFEDEQLKKYKFTGIIENETVDQIFQALRLTAPLNYQIKKDTILLTLDFSSREEYSRIMTKKK